MIRRFFAVVFALAALSGLASAAALYFMHGLSSMIFVIAIVSLTLFAVALGIGSGGKDESIGRRRKAYDGVLGVALEVKPIEDQVASSGQRPWERVENVAGITAVLSPGELGTRDHYMTKVVGVTFYRGGVRSARRGDMLRLIHEPDNPHDENAIAVVLVKNSLQVGHLMRSRAADMASSIRAGAIYQARIEETTGGWFKERGLNIRVWRSGWDSDRHNRYMAELAEIKEQKRLARNAASKEKRRREKEARERQG